MTQPDASCPYGDESDIEARYLAGTMPPDEREQFEEHYFGCARCFQAVQRASELRAALALDAGAESVGQAVPDRGRRRRIGGWPIALAAAIVIIAIGVRERSQGPSIPEDRRALPADAVRGDEATLVLAPNATGDVLMVAWSAPKAARSYRVRLLAADGSLLVERETVDTSVVVSRALLRGADTTAVYWDVQALDALRSVIARSAAVPARSPSPPR